eukprot:11187718-Lingulodinium_polyedra.AAC.1
MQIDYPVPVPPPAPQESTSYELPGALWWWIHANPCRSMWNPSKPIQIHASWLSSSGTAACSSGIDK